MSDPGRVFHREVNSDRMADILIIFHSQTGNTERLARAVAQGVDETAKARAVLKRAVDAVATRSSSRNPRPLVAAALQAVPALW